MAFNLDKNEGAKPSTKFDLSKNVTPAGAPQKKSAKTWLVLIPVLAVAGLVWYLSSNRNADSNKDTATVDSTAANKPERTTTPADTPAAIQGVNAESSTNAATTRSGSTAATTSNNTDAGSAVTASSFNNKIPVTFSKGSVAMSNLDGSLIKELVSFLKHNPAAVITVNGYASSEGEPSLNQQISRSRAEAFKNHLVLKGIDANRIKAAGKGTDNPISSNDTEEGRVKNRRVEILLQ